MWRNPLLIAGGEFFSLEITNDTLIGDLWTFLGSPSAPTNVSILVDGCDVGDIQISTQFAGGSTFDFTCQNGGRILGLGGAGGNGCNATSPYGGKGSVGTKGGAAITSVYDVTVDVDDGYLFGGGGGGGGGAGIWVGFSGGGFVASGGGGGGGQGYTGGAKGNGGNNGYSGQNGIDGSRTAPGAGGGAQLANLHGGDGGKWGSGGQVGKASGYLIVSAGITRNIGGVGGNGGRAFSGTGATISFNGAKSEATLRSEGRILGETGGVTPLYVTGGIEDFYGSGSPASSTHGGTWQSDGDLLFLGASNSLSTTKWINGTLVGIGAEYDIRALERPDCVDKFGTWDASAAADNTWIGLSSNRTWSFTNVSGARDVAQVFEIRRNDVPGNPDDEIIASLWLHFRDTG
jgi:hypothetical protein